MPPQFTAAQAAAGKTAYNANCAVCHGNTMTNGTFGPPLAGEYFKKPGPARRCARSTTKRRPCRRPLPASLPDATYANIVAYILETNGARAGNTAMPAEGTALEGMKIRSLP